MSADQEQPVDPNSEAPTKDEPANTDESTSTTEGEVTSDDQQ